MLLLLLGSGVSQGLRLGTHLSSPVASAGCWCSIPILQMRLLRTAWTNVALCPGVRHEDEGPKAEGSFLFPAQCCVESSRFASKDLKTNGVGDVSQPTPSGTRSSVPGDMAGPPSGLAVGPAPPCACRAPPPALPAQGSHRPAWPTSSQHPGCGQQ